MLYSRKINKFKKKKNRENGGLSLSGRKKYHKAIVNNTVR